MKLQNIKILLADDDEDDRELFQEALGEVSKTCELFTVNNGEKLVNFFTENNSVPDFIFLDINMPKRNGIECLKYIKKLYPVNNFHIIMLSTTSAVSTVELSYQYGASVYIQKPSRFDDLVKYIGYCLNNLEHNSLQGDFILNQRLKGDLKNNTGQ